MQPPPGLFALLVGAGQTLLLSALTWQLSLRSRPEPELLPVSATSLGERGERSVCECRCECVHSVSVPGNPGPPDWLWHLVAFVAQGLLFVVGRCFCDRPSRPAWNGDGLAPAAREQLARARTRGRLE